MIEKMFPFNLTDVIFISIILIIFYVVLKIIRKFRRKARVRKVSDNNILDLWERWGFR